MDVILSKKWFYLILGLCCLVNIAIIFIKPIFFDPSVYWFYAHHLRWVYADAPPLIGVVTWLGLTVFGSHSATINILGLLSILISTCFLYLLAKSMFNENLARVSALIWFITPTTLHYYFRWSWSYNNLILLFSIMATYFFYEAGKTKSPRYFYFTAIALAGALLSQISSMALILTLFVPLIILPSYRKFFKSKHFYFSLILLILMISPYLVKLIQSNWLPFTYLTGGHANVEHHAFALEPMIQMFLNVINEINLFFVIGLWLIIKNFRAITKNENLMFCFLVSGSLFLLALIASIKYGIGIRYYYPFYFGFILLFVSFAKGRWIKWLMFAIYINLALFIMDSWNVMVPQYGLGPGSGVFNDRNHQVIGQAIGQTISPNDILIPRTFQGDFISIASNANHVNTYFESPGLFIWQASLQQILTQNKGNKIFYLSDTQTAPSQNLGLSCGAWQTFSSSMTYHLSNKSYASTYYLSQCTVK